MLSDRLPKTFLGYPTNFAPAGERIRHMSCAAVRLATSSVPPWSRPGSCVT